MKKSLRIPAALIEQIDCRAQQENQETFRRWTGASDEHQQLVENAVERSAEFDRKVEAAIEQVEIPTGLKQRLLAAVDQSDQISETCSPQDASGITDSIDEALAAELVNPSENDKVLASAADSRAPKNIPSWTWTLGWVAATLLISLPAIGIHHALNPPAQVSQMALARDAGNWIGELESGLQAEEPVDFAYCENINYGNLRAEGFKEIATGYGEAKGTVWKIRDFPVDLGKCYTMTIRINGRFNFHFGNTLPRDPLPLVSSRYFVAASVDARKKFLHIVMAPNEEVYLEKIRMPIVEVTSLWPKNDTDTVMIAAENLPPEILQQLRQLSQPN